MTDFNELGLGTDVSDMDDDEVRETLVEFMEAHQKNQEAYDETVSEFEDRIDEVQAQKDDLEQTIGELKTEYAEAAAEHVNMPAELLEERFDFNEIRQILEESAEFADADDDENDGLPLTDFADKEQKGETSEGGEEGGDGYGFREDAATHLERHGIHVEG